MIQYFSSCLRIKKYIVCLEIDLEFAHPFLIHTILIYLPDPLDLLMTESPAQTSSGSGNIAVDSILSPSNANTLIIF